MVKKKWPTHFINPYVCSLIEILHVNKSNDIQYISVKIYQTKLASVPNTQVMDRVLEVRKQ